jgi:hypothetical protein
MNRQLQKSKKAKKNLWLIFANAVGIRTCLGKRHEIQKQFKLSLKHQQIWWFEKTWKLMLLQTNKLIFKAWHHFWPNHFIRKCQATFLAKTFQNQQTRNLFSRYCCGNKYQIEDTLRKYIALGYILQVHSSFKASFGAI